MNGKEILYIMDTSYGKILYRFDKDDNCLLARVLRIYKPDNLVKTTKLYAYAYPNYNIEYAIDAATGIDANGNKWTPLESDGVLFVGHATIVAANNKLDDIIAVYFDKNDDTPKVIARQSLIDIYASMLSPNTSKVGFSVTKESCPSPYSMSSFMLVNSIDYGFFMSLYKVDTVDFIKKLYDFNRRWNFHNVDWIKALDSIDKVFSTLRDNRLLYCSRNIKGFNTTRFKEENLPVDGFCPDFKSFASSVGLFDDINTVMGIGRVDFELENDKTLNKEEMQLISLIYGGVKICKTVVAKYSFDIDLEEIKMNYFLIMDSKNELYIVGYTTDETEVTVAELEEVNKNEEKLRERLKKAVRAFDGYDIDILEQAGDSVAKNDTSNNILPEEDLRIDF